MLCYMGSGPEDRVQGPEDRVLSLRQAPDTNIVRAFQMGNLGWLKSVLSLDFCQPE